MRQRNHKCEQCGRIYITLGSRPVRRNWCSEACRKIMLRTQENEKRRIRYRVDPEFRARIAWFNKQWRVYRQTEVNRQKRAEYFKQRYERKIITAQIGRLIHRINGSSK